MMYLGAEKSNLLIQLKKYLRSGGHFQEEKQVDQMLCQYEYSNILAKKQYLERLILACHVRAYGDLYIPDIEWSEWTAFLSRVEEMSRMLLAELDVELKEMPLREIWYNGKLYSVMSDAVNWVRNSDIVVFLLQDDGEFFEDNIVAVDLAGNYLWSSRDVIEVKNRVGAAFVSLAAGKENSLYAGAYVGVRYELDIRTGKVLDSVITK